MQTKIRAEQTNTDSATQTLTNKNISSTTNTFPSSLATLTGTQTLTNKTLTSPTITNPVAQSDWSYVSVSRSGSAQSISSGSSATTVIFNSEGADLRGEYNTSTGIFTADVTGYYAYDAQISWSPGFSGATRIQAICAGGQQRYLYFGSVSRYTPCCISGTTKLTAGQTIYITARQESGSTQNVYHDGGLTNLTIVRVQ